MNAICLSIDRLSAGYLGAYGNTWIETPALDRFACEGITFDHAWCESPRLDELYRSLWQGIHPLSHGDKAARGGCDRGEPLARHLSQAGVGTTLLSDEWAVAENPLARSFDELVEIEPKAVEDRPAGEVLDEYESGGSIEQTHAAECFARIIDWLTVARGPFFLHCHLTGLGGPWDAPYEFRRRYAEEGDPSPPMTVRPPSLRLEDDYDPDTLLGITQSYAGQVSLFDTCIGALNEFVAESGLAKDTLLAIISPRGYPLGEHHRVGPCDEALYGETLHVPLMIRFPDGLAASARSQALVAPADLGPTLLDWWGLPAGEELFDTTRSLMPLARGEAENVRDRICVAGVGDGRAIRTPAWFLRMEDGDSLFTKPDDRWEFNDVANRCQNVVASLHDVADEFQRHLQTGEPTDLSPLDDVLIEGLE